jgi:hypothetical protein
MVKCYKRYYVVTAKSSDVSFQRCQAYWETNLHIFEFKTRMVLRASGFSGH